MNLPGGSQGNNLDSNLEKPEKSSYIFHQEIIGKNLSLVLSDIQPHNEKNMLQLIPSDCSI